MLKDLIKEKYAKPGVYVGVKWCKDDMSKIHSFFKDKIDNAFNYVEFHTTLAYSKTYFDYVSNDEDHKATIKGLHVFRNDKLNHTALVLKLDSSSLSKRHKEIHNDSNASYDFDEYVPHITLSYDVSTMDKKDLDYILSDEFLKIVKAQNFTISRGKEYKNNLDNEFEKKVKLSKKA